MRPGSKMRMRVHLRVGGAQINTDGFRGGRHDDDSKDIPCELGFFFVPVKNGDGGKIGVQVRKETFGKLFLYKARPVLPHSTNF